MTSQLSVFGRAIPVAGALAIFCVATAAAAPSALEGENGRYSMVPIAEGVLRLDTRTGNLSTCKDSGTGWACYAAPDERAAWDAEIGRLQDEVERLKSQLASREQAPAVPPQPTPPQAAAPPPAQPPFAEPKASEGRKIEIPLPSDADVDRVMSFLERSWRRLIDMAGRVQKDVSGKI